MGYHEHGNEPSGSVKIRRIPEFRCSCPSRSVYQLHNYITTYPAWHVTYQQFYQERQCKHNVTLNTFVQPLLQWERDRYYPFWVWVCSLRYLVCNAHALHCHPWPVWLSNIFFPPYYLIQVAIFKEKLLNTKYVFWFPLKILSNISYSKKNSAQCKGEFHRELGKFWVSVRNLSHFTLRRP